MRMAIELNGDDYETETTQAEIPVVVDFWGPQCAPCLALNPFMEKLEEEYNGRIKFAKLNAAVNRMLCARLRVLGLPTFLFYKDGQEFKRITGEDITVDHIKQEIEALLD
jgi:thioredoxin 1